MASLRTFWPSVPGMSSPDPETGDAAPMLVPDAMTATWPASVMNVPALAARAPDGATQTIVGSGGVEQARHDLLRRVEAPARRVQADDHGRRAVPGRDRDPLLEVAGEHLVHDPGGRQDDDGPAGGARAVRRPGSR